MNEGSELVRKEKKLTLWGIFLRWLDKKTCHHEWELKETITFSYSKRLLYVCTKCGKWKKISLERA